jgi:hypothetical protein
MYNTQTHTGQKGIGYGKGIKKLTPYNFQKNMGLSEDYFF